MNIEYNDYELVNLAQEQNEEATELLSNKYYPIIKKLSIKYYTAIKVGIDLNDIKQECYLAFLNAIDTFQENKNICFYTYAISCMKKHLISIVRTYTSDKNQYLNESLSLDKILNDTENTISNYIEAKDSNPENIIIEEEEYNILYNKIIKYLTPLEECVITLKKEHYNYTEIASILDKSIKSIDNCFQRIKLKIKNLNSLNY